MGGAHDLEVPMIQSGHSGCAKAFSDCDNRRVGAPEPQIGVLLDQGADAPPIAWAEILDSQAPVGDGGVERCFGDGSQLTVDEIGSLCDDQGGRDKRSVVTLQEGPA